MASEIMGVGVDSMDDAAPDGDELAARLADVVFDWQPTRDAGPASTAERRGSTHAASTRWMSRRARAGLDTPS